jgi:hypothetical protein
MNKLFKKPPSGNQQINIITNLLKLALMYNAEGNSLECGIEIEAAITLLKDLKP